MPRIVTFNELRGLTTKGSRVTILREAADSLHGKNLFLSHSSKDLDLLPNVIGILEDHGARVYIDKTDEGLPETVSAETAARLQVAVESCRRFVLFVTTNSKDSKWIPWELGLGAGSKGDDKIALFPSAENSRNSAWTNQEYLGLYRRIVWGKFQGEQAEEWMVWNHRDNVADRLGDWIMG